MREKILGVFLCFCHLIDYEEGFCLYRVFDFMDSQTKDGLNPHSRIRVFHHFYKWQILSISNKW